MLRFVLVLQGAGHSALLEFLVTYLVHSLLWAFGAWVLVRALRPIPSTESWVWLLALLGPLVLSVAAVLFPWGIASSSPEAAAEAVASSPASLSVVHAAVGYLDRWDTWIGLVCGLALGLGAARYLGSWAQLSRQLRDRGAVQSAPVRESFERATRLLGCEGVRLSSAEIAVPLIVGRREICVPRDLRGFSELELDAMFAHELAHLERRDGAWFLVVGAIASATWFMPHNAWLGRRFRRSAELACDARCVQAIGDRSALARALTRMASEVVGARRQGLAPSMARDSGALVERVRLLIRPNQTKHLRQGNAAPILLLLAGLAIPRLGIARAAATDPGLSVAPASTPEAEMAALADEEAELARRLREASVYHSADSGKPSDEVVNELQQQLRFIHGRQAEAERRATAARAK